MKSKSKLTILAISLFVTCAKENFGVKVLSKTLNQSKYEQFLRCLRYKEPLVSKEEGIYCTVGLKIK